MAFFANFMTPSYFLLRIGGVDQFGQTNSTFDDGVQTMEDVGKWMFAFFHTWQLDVQVVEVQLGIRNSRFVVSK